MFLNYIIVLCCKWWNISRNSLLIHCIMVVQRFPTELMTWIFRVLYNAYMKWKLKQNHTIRTVSKYNRTFVGTETWSNTPNTYTLHLTFCRSIDILIKGKLLFCWRAHIHIYGSWNIKYEIINFIGSTTVNLFKVERMMFPLGCVGFIVFNATLNNT